jgi:hypothetical protein
LTTDVLMVILLIPFIINCKNQSFLTRKALTRFFQILHFFFQYLFNGTVKRQEFNFIQPTAMTIYNYIHILFFSTLMPIVAIIGFFFFLFDYLITKASIYYFFKKSNDHGSAFLRESVRNLVFFLLIYPFFITLLLIRFRIYYFIPFFVVCFVLVIGFGIGFLLYWRYSRHHTFAHKSSNELSELTTDEESIKYKHPMTDVYNQSKALE